LERKEREGSARFGSCCRRHRQRSDWRIADAKGAAPVVESLDLSGMDLSRANLDEGDLEEVTSQEERRASQLLLFMLAGHRNVRAPWQVEFLL
jgi:hypothetical protein